MAEPFVGQIIQVGFNFAPKGYATCDGQTIAIQQNTALFSLIGTTYGGNGSTTFQLPDLRGRTPLHWGQGPGLPLFPIGQSSGSESVTLAVTQMPAHSHLILAENGGNGTANPSGAFPATEISGQGLTAYSTTIDTTMAPSMIGNTGSNFPHNNLQPLLTINYCIALQGVFPSRN